MGPSGSGRQEYLDDPDTPDTDQATSWRPRVELASVPG